MAAGDTRPYVGESDIAQIKEGQPVHEVIIQEGVYTFESVDGAATQDGLSQALQTPGDNRVFAALRDLADTRRDDRQPRRSRPHPLAGYATTY